MIHREMTAEVLSALANEQVLALDLETSGLNPFRDETHVISLYGPSSEITLVLHTKGGLPMRIVDFLNSYRGVILCHNAVGFDAYFLARCGVKVTELNWYDTLVGEQCAVTSSRRDVSVSLRASLRRRLGLDVKKDIEHSWAQTAELSDEQVEYAAADVQYLPALREEQRARVKGTPAERALTSEMQLVPVTIEMTLNGMPVDLAKYRADVGSAGHRAAAAKERLTELIGNVNLRSPVQLRAIFNAIGAQVDSTREEILLMLVNSQDGRIRGAAQSLLDYREADQRIKVYGPKDSGPDWLDRHVVDGVVHARFWQLGTDTGRYSSSDPNLQQVPKSMRGVYGGIPGCTVVWADYSQIEVLAEATIARDAQLIADYNAGDVHQNIGARMWRIPAEEIEGSMRDRAKAVTFTCLFGGGANGVLKYAKMLGLEMTWGEADDLVVAFHESYRRVHNLIQRARVQAHRGGGVKVTLPSGLQRVLAGDTLTATRILNTSVQGAAACGLKNALLECKRRGLVRYIGATIHDEIVAPWVPDGEVEGFTAELKDAMLEGMERAIGEVPRLSIKSGTHWG